MEKGDPDTQDNQLPARNGKERKEQKLVFLKNELSSDDTSLRKEITIQPGIDVKNAKGDGDRSGESLKDNSKIDDRMKIDSHGINQISFNNPNFHIDMERINTNGLKLPEEDKHEIEFADGLFKINFANDPVMKSLLEAKQDQCALAIQRVYLSKQCRIVYFLMIIVCSMMVIWTLIDSKAWKTNIVFIIAEFIINMMVTLDIIFKIKITGCTKYFKTCSNLFDFFVALGCVSLSTQLYLLCLPAIVNTY